MRIFKSDNYIKNNLISASMKDVQGTTRYHGHNFLEIEFVVDGSGFYEIDGTSYPIKKNTVFIINPLNIHSLRDVNATFVNVMFVQDVRENEFDYYFYLKNQNVITLDEETGELLNILFLEIAKNSETAPDYSMDVLRCIFFKLTQNKINTDEQVISYVSKAFFYIHSRFNQRLSLYDISAYLGLSPAYFSDLFRREVGTGFKEYLDDIRFSYVKKLLRYSDLSVKEAYLRAGFSDYSNFSRRFKNKFQLTPTEYRKKR